MIEAARLLRIVPPPSDRSALVRPAMEAIAKALASGWRSDGPEAVIDGLAVIRPLTRWIGACRTDMDEFQLRLLHDVLRRCLEGDLEHPGASSYEVDGEGLARAMLLARADRVPPSHRTTVVVAEAPNPWGAPRMQWHVPGSSTTKKDASLLDEQQAALWATLAPPSVSVFLSDQAPGSTLAGVPMIAALNPVHVMARTRDLTTDPIARLRAHELLAKAR